MSVIRIITALLFIAIFMAMPVHAQDGDTATVTVPEVPVNLAMPEPALSNETSPAEGSVDPALIELPVEGSDIILVLDNSISMKTNDPQSELAGAVTAFVAKLDDATNVAIFIFDQTVKLAVPLIPASLENRERITTALVGLDYSGQFSDSPAAIEQAVQQLQLSGRPAAEKSIVFLTDGDVQTGNETNDTARTAWLQQSLAVDIAAAGIRIYGIGFADAANSELVNTLALKTGGESFHATSVSDLAGAFTSVFDYMQQQAGPVRIESPAEAAPAIVEPPPPPVIAAPTTTPVTKAAGQEERTRSIIIFIAAVILFLTLAGLIFLLVKRGRIYKQASAAVVSEAFLFDLNGVTSSAQYKLGQKPTMFGRVAGKDVEHLDYIVIPESTIGRRHATIDYKDYAYWIMDQGSINGTFVNDVRITSEIRLKHGDRIRLHKVEFEFVMPDMEEAGKTRLAEPAAAASVAGATAEAVEIDIEAVKSSLGNDGFDLDFDFTGGDAAPAQAKAGRKDETLMPGFNAGVNDLVPESDEVTLMPDHQGSVVNKPTAHVASHSTAGDDETLMPDKYTGIEDDDATVRPAVNTSSDDIFDVTGADDKKR
jgi:pSer/pThr/pTyr-binding forkhead associated (FHA) protein